MRINRPIFYNQHYYFDKQELGEDVKPILNSKKDDIENKNKKDELFDLYRAGQLERLCGIQPTEKEWMPALDAIGRCFEFTTEVSINLTNYCSVNGVYIGCPHNPDIQIEPAAISQPNAINAFKVIPFCLNLDAIQKEKVIFDISYSIYGTVSQNLIPSLEFYSKEKTIQQYSSSEESIVDLSQIGQRTISFEIPAMDIFTQNEGYYILKLGTFDFVKIEFPRCGLPINEGIYSLAELRDFCDKLNGSPTDEMISFYELLKNGIITQWLQDNEEEGKYKEEIYESYRKIKAEHPFRINDINSVLEIVSKRTISFSLYDYISIEIVNAKLFDSESIIRTVADHNHFIKWKSNSRGKIEIHIEPEEDFVDVADVLDWNLEFKIGFCVGDKHLQGKPISFNLSDLKDKGKHFDFYFKCEDFSGQHMGTYPLSIVSGKERIKTDYSFSITGEIIDLKLPGGIPFPMVGIMYGEGNFYIAQTPITQEQFQVIAKNAIRIWGDMQAALSKSVNAYKWGNYPATHLTYHDCIDIVDYLKDVFTHSFYIPNYKHLYAALCNGFSDESIKFNAKKYEHLLEVRNNHRTKLEVFDLLNNIYLHTTDTISHPFRPDERICFGSTYFELNDNPKRKFCEEGKDDYSCFGFCPIAFNIVQPKEDTHTDKDNDSHTTDSESSSIDSSWMDDYVNPIDFATFL